MVDVSGIREIGEVITLEDLAEIEGVKILAEPDTVIVRSDYLAAAPVGEEEEEAAVEGLLEEEGVEPEVIGRSREDEEDED
jgi:hypothetical protein